MLFSVIFFSLLYGQEKEEEKEEEREKQQETDQTELRPAECSLDLLSCLLDQGQGEVVLLIITHDCARVVCLCFSVFAGFPRSGVSKPAVHSYFAEVW